MYKSPISIKGNTRYLPDDQKLKPILFYKLLKAEYGFIGCLSNMNFVGFWAVDEMSVLVFVFYLLACSPMYNSPTELQRGK